MLTLKLSFLSLFALVAAVPAALPPISAFPCPEDGYCAPHPTPTYVAPTYVAPPIIPTPYEWPRCKAGQQAYCCKRSGPHGRHCIPLGKLLAADVTCEQLYCCPDTGSYDDKACSPIIVPY